MKQWTYVAIHTLISKTASIMPNIAWVHDSPKAGVTTKACHRGFMNVRGKGFGGSPYVGNGSGIPDYKGWDGASAAPLTNPWGCHSWLTVGEYQSKALSVVKPHEDLEPIENDHFLRRLIENPNGHDTCFDLLYELGMFEELCGVAYLWAVPNNFGMPCELWVLPSHWVWPRTGGGRVPDGGAKQRRLERPEFDPGQEVGDYARYAAQYVNPDSPNADRLIQYYEVRPWGGFGSAGVLRLPPDEVIMMRWKSPINKIDGYSKLAAAAQWIDEEESISKSRWSQAMNVARPEFWVKLGPGYEDPDDDRINRYEAKLAAKIQGEHNYGKPIFTPPGAELVPLSFNPTEMAYFQSEEQIRDMILSTFAVPKSCVGIADNMTYGALLATLASLCTHGINPRLAKRGQDLTKHLASRWDEKPSASAWSNGLSYVPTKYITRGYGGRSQGRKARIWYDDCVPADPSQINADIQQDWTCHAITPNEIRALRGRKPFGLGGDNPWSNGPAGEAPFPINVKENVQNMEDIAEILSPLITAGQPPPQQDPMMGGMDGGVPGQQPLDPMATQPGQDTGMESNIGQVGEYEANPAGEATGQVGQSPNAQAGSTEGQASPGTVGNVPNGMTQRPLGIKQPNRKPEKSYVKMMNGVEAAHPEEKGIIIDVSEALQEAGERLANRKEPPYAMPGYGQIFIRDDRVWYVGGDGDDDGLNEIVDSEIRDAYAGVEEVIYESEGFPPRSEGWVQVYPEIDGEEVSKKLVQLAKAFLSAKSLLSEK